MADVKSMVYKGATVGVQTALHTEIAATKKLGSLGFSRIMPKAEGGFMFTAQGNRVATQSVPPGQHSSEVGFDGILTFNELAYILSTIFGAPAVTADGTNGKVWEFLFTLNSEIQRKYLTYYNGVGSELRSVIDMFADSLSIEMSKATQKVSGTMKAGKIDTPSLTITVAVATTTPGETGVTEEVQTINLSGGDDPVSGTWTITVPAFGTTVPLAWDASAAVVDAALEAILGTGLVVVGKVGFVYTLTYDDTLGNIGQATVDSDNLSAYAAATEITPKILFPQNFDVYISDTYANLLTAISGADKFPIPLSVMLDIPSITNLIYRMNSADESYYQPADLPVGATLKLKTGDDTDDYGAVKAYFTNNATLWVGVRNLGDVIAGASASQEQFLLTFAGRLIQPEDPDEQDGAATNTFNLDLIHDGTANRSLGIKLINTLAAL
jgi:hypothetical protein